MLERPRATLRQVLAIVSALVVAVGAGTYAYLGFRGFSSSAIALDATVQEAPTTPLESDAPRSNDARVPAAIPVSDPIGGASSASQETNAQQGFGAVSGRLFDFEGTPVPRARLSFSRDPGSWNGVSVLATTDPDGYYFIEKLPAGVWEVLYHGHSRSADDSSGRRLSGVLLPSGRTTVLDLVLEGDRRVTGSLLVEGEPNLLLQLELFRGSNHAEPDAFGWCQAGEAPPQQGPEGGGVEGEVIDDGPRGTRRQPGSYRFEGLAADRYVLRITLSRDESGQPLFVERTLDLTNASVDLPLEVLSWNDFLEAYRQRSAR